MENEREPYYCDVPGHEDEELSGNADDDFDVDDVDAPNISPYKKCSVCEERKSCGNYDDNKVWFCEDCYVEDDDDHDAEGSDYEPYVEGECCSCYEIRQALRKEGDKVLESAFVAFGFVYCSEDCYYESSGWVRCEEEDEGKCGCCRKQMPEGDTWCCEGECGLLTCPDCRPDDDEGACVICQQEEEDKKRVKLSKNNYEPVAARTRSKMLKQPNA